MNKFGKLLILSAALVSVAACTRIETGEVGVRIAMDKQIEKEELKKSLGLIEEIIELIKDKYKLTRFS